MVGKPTFNYYCMDNYRAWNADLDYITWRL